MKYSQLPNHPFWESRILSGNTCHEISDLCVVSPAFLRFNAFRCCRCSVESCTLQTTSRNSKQFFGCECFYVNLTLALSLSLCQKALFCHFFIPSFLRSVFLCYLLTLCSSTGRVGCEVIESPFCHGEDAEEEEEAEVPIPMERNC